MFCNRYLAGGVAAITLAAGASRAATTRRRRRIKPVDPLFKSYVSIGNSITAGYQSARHQRLDAAAELRGALREAGQHELPHSAAEQAGLPAADRELRDAGSSCGGPDAPPCALRANEATPGPINNVAVPGATSLSPTGAVPGPDTLVENALTTFILGGETQVQRAAEAQPTFVSVWIGNNDVLNASLSGILPGDAGHLEWRHVHRRVHDELQESREGAQGDSVDQGRSADWRRQHDQRAASLPRGAAQQSAGEGRVRCGGGHDDRRSIRRRAPPTTTSLINFQLAGAIRSGAHPPTIFCEALPAPFAPVGNVYVLDAAEQAR